MPDRLNLRFVGAIQKSIPPMKRRELKLSGLCLSNITSESQAEIATKVFGLAKATAPHFLTTLRHSLHQIQRTRKKMIDREARNTVNAFLSFERPSLKLDFGTMPSNPTPNRSVINVEGTDEAWVVLTADKVRSFLSDRSVRRPFIHESGSYDYFLYFAYFPILLWIWSRFRDSPPMIWIESQSLLFSLVVSSYVFLLSLIIARIAFQYARWLFPPMEYLGGRRARWVVQRTVFGCAIGSLALAAAYDIAKAVFRSLF